MLAFTLLLRNWRSGELKLLGISLVLAVAVLSGIAIFTDRLKSTLVAESNRVLSADFTVNSPYPHAAEWPDAAQKQGIRNAHASSFTSMVYAGDEMHLATVKAVAAGYPLRGEFEVSQIPFAINPTDIKKVNTIPNPGEVWVDSRLLPLLNIKLGDKIAVGEYELTATQVIIREPDSTNPLIIRGARVIMNIADLPLTQVVQPGSRVDYQWLLAADNTSELKKFTEWLKPQLTKNQQLVDMQSSQPRLGQTLTTGEKFLLLAGVIAVLLAGVAIAIASRQFSARHTDQVALMKSLGVSAARIRSLYLSQLLLLGTLAALMGLGLGSLIQELAAASMVQIYRLHLVSASVHPYALSFVSGLICLVFFSLPALWFLPGVPPLKILRRELVVNTPQLWLQALLALGAVMLLILLFSGDITLALSMTAALVAVLIMSFVIAWLLLLASKKLILHFGGVWRLAFAHLLRNKGQSLVQILVFAIAIMLLFTLMIVRTSLIEVWKAQVPENAPNHVLANIAPADLSQVQQLISQQGVIEEPLYPMVSGRLTHINDAEPTEALRDQAFSLRHELNLTWSDQLAADNKILEGQWWDLWQRSDAQLPGVSAEIETAKSMGLKIGDHLRFSIGGLILDAEVASFRSLDWSSMRPNFHFMFEPNVLTTYSPTYTTSIYLPSEQKSFINQLLREHPTIMVIEFDHIIEQIQTLIDQVSDGVQLVLWLTLMGGCLVLFAAVMNSIDDRKQEAGLLRALGSGRKLILGSVFTEFALIGFLSGFIGIVGAEILSFSLQTFVLQTPIQPHYVYWVASPVLSALFVSLLGVTCCCHVVTTPPAVVLREAF